MHDEDSGGRIEITAANDPRPTTVGPVGLHPSSRRPVILACGCVPVQKESDESVVRKVIGSTLTTSLYVTVVNLMIIITESVLGSPEDDSNEARTVEGFRSGDQTGVDLAIAFAVLQWMLGLFLVPLVVVALVRKSRPQINAAAICAILVMLLAGIGVISLGATGHLKDRNNGWLTVLYVLQSVGTLLGMGRVVQLCHSIHDDVRFFLFAQTRVLDLHTEVMMEVERMRQRRGKGEGAEDETKEGKGSDGEEDEEEEGEESEDEEAAHSDSSGHRRRRKRRLRSESDDSGAVPLGADSSRQDDHPESVKRNISRRRSAAWLEAVSSGKEGNDGWGQGGPPKPAFADDAKRDAAVAIPPQWQQQQWQWQQQQQQWQWQQQQQQQWGPGPSQAENPMDDIPVQYPGGQPPQAGGQGFYDAYGNYWDEYNGCYDTEGGYWWPDGSYTGADGTYFPATQPDGAGDPQAGAGWAQPQSPVPTSPAPPPAPASTAARGRAENMLHQLLSRPGGAGAGSQGRDIVRRESDPTEEPNENSPTASGAGTPKPPPRPAPRPVAGPEDSLMRAGTSGSGGARTAQRIRSMGPQHIRLPAGGERPREEEEDQQRERPPRSQFPYF